MDIAISILGFITMIMFLVSLFSDDGNISSLPKLTKIVIYIQDSSNSYRYHANIGDIVFVDDAYYVKVDKGFIKLNNKQLKTIERVYNIHIK